MRQGSLGTDLAEDPQGRHRGRNGETLGTRGRGNARVARRTEEKTRRVSSSGCRPWEKLPWDGPVG